MGKTGIKSMWFEWSRGVGAAVDDDYEHYFFFYEKSALNDI